MVLIDSHCHLDLPAFKNKQLATLEACWQLGIERILVPGLSTRQFKDLLNLSHTVRSKTSAFAANPNGAQTDNRHGLSHVDICLGCHPYFQNQLNDTELNKQKDALWQLAQAHAEIICGIGECGLDGSLSLPMAFQETVLEQHIDLALQFNKPLILHHRQSHNELISCLKRAKFDKGGIIHAFSGSQQIAETYIDMGFLLGVGGTITYERAKKTRKALTKVPLQHLVLETDSPDMPLSGFQGQANSPTQLPLIAQCLAHLKQCEVQVVQEQTSLNYCRLFNI